MKMFETKIIKGGTRPKIDSKKWGVNIAKFMKDAFVDNPERPSMHEVTEMLRDEINTLSDEEITDILDTSRKSQLSAG